MVNASIPSGIHNTIDQGNLKHLLIVIIPFGAVDFFIVDDLSITGFDGAAVDGGDRGVAIHNVMVVYGGHDGICVGIIC